jgi:hypothetical protein
MAQVSTSTWNGKSGKVYKFFDYTLDTLFRSDAKGNYIFSRREKGREGDILYAIYIGEGVIRERTEFRINEGKIQSKGCNCVSVRELNNGEDSKQIEEDLLAANTEAYEPEGCNIKKGG